MNQLQDFDLKNKKVFIRADLNVPIKSGQITSSTKRIEASLATINYPLSQEGCKSDGDISPWAT